MVRADESGTPGTWQSWLCLESPTLCWLCAVLAVPGISHGFAHVAALELPSQLLWAASVVLGLGFFALAVVFAAMPRALSDDQANECGPLRRRGMEHTCAETTATAGMTMSLCANPVHPAGPRRRQNTHNPRICSAVPFRAVT